MMKTEWISHSSEPRISKWPILITLCNPHRSYLLTWRVRLAALDKPRVLTQIKLVLVDIAPLRPRIKMCRMATTTQITKTILNSQMANLNQWVCRAPFLKLLVSILEVWPRIHLLPALNTGKWIPTKMDPAMILLMDQTLTWPWKRGSNRRICKSW